MKRDGKKRVGLMAICIALVLTALPVYAKSVRSTSIEEVFPEDQVRELQKQAREKTLVDYNNVKGVLTTRSLKSVNKYPTRKGVILTTMDKGNGKMGLLGHAAIVYSDRDVVESVLQNNAGVIMGPNNWDKNTNTCIAVTVSGTSMEQDAAAADWCEKQLGKPYNYDFLDTETRSCFYCSHLIWAAYKDCLGIDLNTTHNFGTAIHPAELVASSRTYKIYEKE